jgi:hypothetical protein
MLRPSCTLLLAALAFGCGTSNGTSAPADVSPSDDAPDVFDASPAEVATPDAAETDRPAVLDAPPSDRPAAIDVAPQDRPAAIDVTETDRPVVTDLPAPDRPAVTDTGSAPDAGPVCEGLTQGACPPGLTCLGFAGFALTWFCGVPCRTDMDCPPNRPRCVLRPDKSNRLYVCE